MMRNFKRIISLIAAVITTGSASVVFCADATALSRSYTKHVFATNSTSTYTLSLDEFNANSRKVIGNDSRKYATREENNGIVLISSVSNSSSHAGTGFIIGDHTIATVAHNLYDEYGFHTHATIYLYDENGDMQFPSVPIVEVHIPTEYISHVNNGTKNTESGTAYDYALITVAADLSERTHFTLSEINNVNDAVLKTKSLYLTGIPRILPDTYTTQNSQYKIYGGVGTLYRTNSNASPIVRYTSDGTEGNSGSPVYFIEQFNVGDDTYYTYSTVSLHHGWISNYDEVYNLGAKVNPYLLNFYGSQNTNVAY